MSVKYKHVDPSAPRMDPQIAMGTCLKPISTSLVIPTPLPFIHPVRPPVPRRNNPACDCWFMCASTATPRAWFSCSTGVLPSTLPCIPEAVRALCRCRTFARYRTIFQKDDALCAVPWWLVLVLWCWYPGQNIGHDSHAASASADAFTCSVCQDSYILSLIFNYPNFHLSLSHFLSRQILQEETNLCRKYGCTYTTSTAPP